MKKLYRNTKRGQIAGVCAGLAYHFNVDVSIVRAVFFILAFPTSGSLGCLAYIALWVATPKLKSKR